MGNNVNVNEYPIPDKLTIYQAAMLWLNVIPKESLYEQLTHTKPDNYFHICGVIIQALEHSVVDQIDFELVNIPSYDTGVLEIHDAYAKKYDFLEVNFNDTDYPTFIERGIDIDVHRSFVTKTALIEIAANEKVPLQFLRRSTNDQNSKKLETIFKTIKSKDDLNRNIDSIISLLIPEIERLWEAFSEKLDRKDFDFQEEVLIDICIDELRKGGYNLIKENHIKANQLFIFRSGQERIDIIGRLIREIIRDYFPRKHNYQAFGKKYRDIVNS